MDTLTELQFLGKIVIAAFLGGVVGMERELAEKPAGLRTHMLVGALSALLVVLANQMILSFDQQNLVATDPVRVLQAIVIGISFLGAGTILKYGPEDARTVEGLRIHLIRLSHRGCSCAKRVYPGSGYHASKCIYQLGYDTPHQESKSKHKVDGSLFQRSERVRISWS